MAEPKSNWIKGAIRHPGAFKRKAKAAGVSTVQFAQQKKGAAGQTGSQARLALTLMGFNHGMKRDRGRGQKDGGLR